MSIELMLNAANINFVVFNLLLHSVSYIGQVFALFIITIAAAELGVGLAIVILIFPQPLDGVDRRSEPDEVVMGCQLEKTACRSACGLTGLSRPWGRLGVPAWVSCVRPHYGDPATNTYVMAAMVSAGPASPHATQVNMDREGRLVLHVWRHPGHCCEVWAGSTKTTGTPAIAPL